MNRDWFWIWIRNTFMTSVRIHDILMWIRIWILLFSSLTLKTPTKTNLEKCISACYVLKVHLHHFSKIKSPKEVTKRLESRFFLLFLLDDRRIWIREAQKHLDPVDPDHCSWLCPPGRSVWASPPPGIPAPPSVRGVSEWRRCAPE